MATPVYRSGADKERGGDPDAAETREARAVRHYRERRGDIVVYVDGVTFGVESATYEGLIYRTNPEDRRCPCPDNSIKHNTCWHIYYAELGRVKSPRPPHKKIGQRTSGPNRRGRCGFSRQVAA